MKKIRTTEIIIETDEIFIMRQSGERIPTLCERCNREIKLTLAQPTRLIESSGHNQQHPKGDTYANDAS